MFLGCSRGFLGLFCICALHVHVVSTAPHCPMHVHHTHTHTLLAAHVLPLHLCDHGFCCLRSGQQNTVRLQRALHDSGATLFIASLALRPSFFLRHRPSKSTAYCRPSAGCWRSCSRRTSRCASSCCRRWGTGQGRAKAPRRNLDQRRSSKDKGVLRKRLWASELHLEVRCDDFTRR